MNSAVHEQPHLNGGFVSNAVVITYGCIAGLIFGYFFPPFVGSNKSKISPTSSPNSTRKLLTENKRCRLLEKGVLDQDYLCSVVGIIGLLSGVNRVDVYCCQLWIGVHVFARRFQLHLTASWRLRCIGLEWAKFEDLPRRMVACIGWWRTWSILQRVGLRSLD